MPTVGPITTTTVPIVYDTDNNGLGGPLNMAGATIGNVTYHQEPDGSLVLAFTLEFAQPNTRYTVYFVCGPAHALGCGFVSLGTLSTDAVGAASTTITVPFTNLQNAPFGPGYRNDHIDLLQEGAPLRSSLAAGAINYFVCASREGLAQPEHTEFGAQRSEAGDPLGDTPTPEGDPHAGGGGTQQSVPRP
jgi:hypothetical protein